MPLLVGTTVTHSPYLQNKMNILPHKTAHQTHAKVSPQNNLILLYMYAINEFADQQAHLHILTSPM